MYDLVVIGAGNTGQAAANRVARAGRKVAVVDKGPVGGLCSLAGCNPKKVFVRATEVLDEIRRAAAHGIHVPEPTIDWSQVVARKHSFTDPMPQQVERGFEQLGIELIRGTARFVAPDRLSVDGRELEARAFVIATGSRPRRFDFPGAELLHPSDDVFELQRPPRRMVIVGSGVVACEFGWVFARLGCEVTIVARGERILSDFDADLMQHVTRFAEKLGIRFAWRSQVRAVRRDGDAFAVDLGGRTLPADFVLNAAGRTPALEELDLARAGVEAGPDGVLVDEYLRSRTNPRVFAGGDAHGEWQLSPVASYEGRVIARNLLDGPVRKVDYTGLPRAVFLTPPLAAVGMGEREARVAGLDIEVVHNELTWWKVFAIPAVEIARGKTIVERTTGRILGAQLWFDGAPDVIHSFALAIKCGLRKADLEEFVYAYPTASSAIASMFTAY